MNVERRLQHAARELRALPVEPPPFGVARAGGATRAPRRVAAMTAPALLVVGALAIAATGWRPAPADAPTAAVEIPATEPADAASATAPPTSEDDRPDATEPNVEPGAVSGAEPVSEPAAATDDDDGGGGATTRAMPISATDEIEIIAAIVASRPTQRATTPTTAPPSNVV